MVWYVDRYLPSTSIQSKLFRYTPFFQISFLLFPLISVSVELCLFLCFQDDLEDHYVPVPQEVIVGYDQTIANNVESISLELVLCQVLSRTSSFPIFSPCMATYPTQHLYFSATHLLNVLSFCSQIFCIIHYRRSNCHHVKFIF
jgi:hypothetical protein